MRTSTTGSLWLVLAVAACTSPAKPKNAPASSQAPAASEPRGTKPTAKTPEDPSKALSAAERLRGTWVLNLNDAPKNAVSEEFQRYKRSKGLADMVKVEYVVTDTEWIMQKTGAGGVYTKSWHYQILQEVDDTLFLERIGDDGEKERIRVTVGTDKLVLGVKGDEVPLYRKHAAE